MQKSLVTALAESCRFHLYLFPPKPPWSFSGRVSSLIGICDLNQIKPVKSRNWSQGRNQPGGGTTFFLMLPSRSSHALAPGFFPFSKSLSRLGLHQTHSLHQIPPIKNTQLIYTNLGLINQNLTMGRRERGGRGGARYGSSIRTGIVIWWSGTDWRFVKLVRFVKPWLEPFRGGGFVVGTNQGQVNQPGAELWSGFWKKGNCQLLTTWQGNHSGNCKTRQPARASGEPKPKIS